MVDGLADLLRLHAGSEGRGGVALDLVHGLVGGGHHEDDQLPQPGGELVLGVDFAVDEPLLDGGKFRVGSRQGRRGLPVQRLHRVLCLFHSVHSDTSNLLRGLCSRGMISA